MCIIFTPSLYPCSCITCVSRRAHGALHDVVRWVHRSTFTIRPPAESSSHGQNRIRSPRGPVRIPIPNVDGFYIDPGWYGTVVLESEGTNEGLVDLQSRCGPGVFPPRAESLATKIRNEKEKENRRVWRILREKRCGVSFCDVCASELMTNVVVLVRYGSELCKSRNG